MNNFFANYLGNPASAMLAAPPFKFWSVEKSLEDDLKQPIIHYVFQQHGLELRCDQYDNVSTIFFHSDEFNGFDDSMLEVRFSSNRQQVRERLGSPSKSGDEVSDPILGEYGAWDRFARSRHVIHVEYRADADRVKRITLIRANDVP